VDDILHKYTGQTGDTYAQWKQITKD